MNKIDIQINQASLSSITFDFCADTQETNVTAKLDLYSGQSRVSSFTISTVSWMNKQNRFNFPVELIAPLRVIQDKLEQVATAICNASLKQLSPVDEVVVEVFEEEDLPF